MVATVSLAVALVASGCTKLAEFNDGLSTLNNPAFVEDTTIYTHHVKNISVQTLTATNGNTNPEIEMSVAVDTGLAGFTPLNNFCGAAGTNPCKCELNWTETNTVGGGSTSFARVRRVDTSSVQSGQVKCKFDQGFWNEIATGTTIRVTIVPVSPNITGLSTKPKGYKKGTTTTANGDFLDDTLTPFRNIHRYTCFSKRTSPHEILNQFTTATDTSNSGTSTPVTILLASRFCTGLNSGQCSTPRNGPSAQSYYRNLYVRSDKMGEINSTNTYYDCPKVVESIRYSAQTPSTDIPSAEKGKYWPLDASFALATEYSSEWSVGVRGGTILYKNGDPNSVSDACMNEDTNKRLSERGIIIKCLGYAKPPKPNGSCGQLTDSNGRVRPMVRLRRYRVIYPGTFMPTGQVDAGPLEADEVYVADRLVVSPTGVPTGAMIYGPKPCNFSWFDHEGVVNRDGAGASMDFGSNMQELGGANLARPAYVSTSAFYHTAPGGATWSVNPDGLIFPRYDRDGSFTSGDRPFCAAALPRVEEMMGTPSQLRVLTSFQSRDDYLALGARKVYLKEVHIKPIDPWTPNYVEDLSFQACVPVADPYVEPPMHFYKKDSNTMAWCSKVYPTQNPYWLDLNAKKKPPSTLIPDVAVNWNAGAGPAPVQIYTSHLNSGAGADHWLDSRNSCEGTQAAEICLMSLGSISHGNYSGCVTYLGGAGRQTCDRTATFDSNQQLRGFPLQAKDSDITQMLSQDLNAERSYSCQYSVHPDPSKVGQRMPLTGCCGIGAGGDAVLRDVLAVDGRSGHLEPQVVPTNSNLRFCGNPVDVP